MYQLTDTDGFDLSEFSGQGYLLGRDGQVLGLIVFYENADIETLVREIEKQLNREDRQ